MAEIRKLGPLRHLRGEPNFHIARFRGGKPVRSERGASFWFLPLSTSVVEVPLDDRELPFLFHGRSLDFQDVTTQGVITYRVVDAEILAQRIDFGIDLDSGAYLRQPLERLALLLSQLAQQLAWGYLAHTPLREILTDGVERIRTRIGEGLAHDDSLREIGIGIVSVRISAIKPTADLEKALQMPTREAIQQTADEATFQRRALAVEKERAIKDNELQNQIELARREEQLIGQKGQNDRRRMTEEAEAERIRADAEAARAKVQSTAQAESIRVVERARGDAERERMETYRTVPPSVLLGLAARELADKLKSIDHLNITPDMVGPLLANLLEAGTQRLQEPAEKR